MIVKQLSEPWFSLIYCGKKTIEIRLDKGYFHELKPYDKIEFFNDELGFNIRRKLCDVCCRLNSLIHLNLH
ncbi:hypothetical protein I4U23_003028 [Adineta vaga]|nr:hypothetical protein I4U23_003028 [Adineta vaga]